MNDLMARELIDTQKSLLHQITRMNETFQIINSNLINLNYDIKTAIMRLENQISNNLDEIAVGIKASTEIVFDVKEQEKGETE